MCFLRRFVTHDEKGSMITRPQPLVDGTMIIVAQTRTSKSLLESCARQFIIEGNGKATNHNPQKDAAQQVLSLQVILNNVRGFVLL